jgi:uncharacterized protein DUF998
MRFTVASADAAPGLQARQSAARTATLATVALVGVGYFALVLIALHFLRTDYNPIKQPTSEYAVGPYGSLMTSAFVGMSVGSLALALGLSQGLPRPARSRIGLVLLGIWAVGVVIAAIFPIDLEGAPETTAGTIHRINGPLAFFSLAVAANLISRGFGHDERWRPFHRLAQVLALIMLVEFVAVAIARNFGLGGLAQRIFIVTFVVWLLSTAARLRSLAIGSSAAR